MALYKRRGWFWTDFSLDGTRYRQPLDTKDWREAQGAEKDKIALAKAGKLSPVSQGFTRLGFSDAVDAYIAGCPPRPWAVLRALRLAVE